MVWPDPDMVEKLFIPTWIGLGIATCLFFWFATPALKRKARPFIMIGIGAIFLIFCLLMGPLRQFWIVLVVVPLIIFLNLRTVRVCGHCGLVNRPSGFFKPPAFCGRCGASLD